MLSYSGKFAFAVSLIRHVRNVSLSSGQFYPRSFRKSPDEVQSQEMDTIAEIESNMFDAPSQQRSSPIDTKKLLKSYRNVKAMPAKVSHPGVKSSKTVKTSPVPVAVPSSRKLIDTDLNLSYVKLGRNDARLSTLLLAVKSRKARNKRQQILMEGRRLILDALQAGLHLQTVIFSQKEHLAALKDQIRPLNTVEIVRVPQQDLRSWSTLTACPGIIAIFQRPSNDDMEERFSKNSVGSIHLPITVICDNVREPSNLGSIIRTCAAIPCDEIIVTKGCCDPWDTKALRGGCGAQFYIRIHDDITWGQIFEAYPQSLVEERRAQTKAVSTLVYLAENNVENSQRFNVPIQPYTEMQVNDHVERCVLVIGGETHGISEEAYRFAKHCNKPHSKQSGGCLHIPMSPNIESLNTASALTLLLFELRRRLSERQKQDDDVVNLEDTVLC